MSAIRLLRRFCLMNAFEEGGGGGAAVESAPAPVAVEAPAAPVADPVAPVATAAKPSMLDAISTGLDKKQTQAAPAALTAPRDPAGRFVPKVGADGQPLPGQPAAGSVVAADPAKTEPADDDITAMPEGLGQKGQERFQRLANSNKELNTQVDTLNRQVEYVRETFGKHGVKQEQFEQAAGVIGMLNRGDFEGAQRILETQLQQIAVMSGRPLGQVDALASFPDLRQAVDGMQITEQHAMEIARGRAQQHQQQVGQQREQQAQQSQQAEQQAVQQGTLAVDDFCKRMLASDLDYAAIEAQLLPEIPNLLQGVPPARWAQAVEMQYRLIKKVAGSARQSAAPAIGSNPLRATGHGSPKQAPQSMHEAMWGAAAPR